MKRIVFFDGEDVSGLLQREVVQMFMKAGTKPVQLVVKTVLTRRL